jgi:hypothetical protein
MPNDKFPLYADLVRFIIERHNIYKRRTADKPKPWTNDPILRQYRFCNVYRELDRVTRWIARNWREPHDGDQDLWFAMFVARYLNLPTTLKAIGYPVPWNHKRVRNILIERRNNGLKTFNAAYIISTQGQAKDKIEYVCDFFDMLWANREMLRPRRDYTLAEYNLMLTGQRNVGNFMSGQVIADLKYANPLQHAKDWNSFAISGPGSRRGLNRVCGQDIKKPWKEPEWWINLNELRKRVNTSLPSSMEKLHGQDMQNCLCEFDKYRRAVLGTGRPKQKYDGNR